MGETMLIFMMVCAEKGIQENVIANEAFQTLTGCTEMSEALNRQDVFNTDGFSSKPLNRFFDCHCRPRRINRSLAGSDIFFRDPEKEYD